MQALTEAVFPGLGTHHPGATGLPQVACVVALQYALKVLINPGFTSHEPPGVFIAHTVLAEAVLQTPLFGTATLGLYDVSSFTAVSYHTST